MTRKKRVEERKKRANGELITVVRELSRAETDECVVIPGHSRRPTLNYEGRGITAARLVWIFRHGEPADGLWVLHSCHNDLCVNVCHLYLGDAARNSADMAATRRSTRGERNPQAKLTRVMVEEARELYATGAYRYKDLARRYGVNTVTIFKAVKGETWKK